VNVICAPFTRATEAKNDNPGVSLALKNSFAGFIL